MQSGLSILSRKGAIHLNKHLFCLCISLIFLLCGCNANTTKETVSAHTTITTSAFATKASDSTTTTADTTISSASSHTTFTEGISEATQDVANTTNSAQSTAHATVSDTAISTTIATPSASSTTTTTPTAGTTTAPALVTFTATVRNDQRQPVSDVTVSVWASDDVMIGHGITNDRGVARITLADYPVHSYHVKLSNLPAGYEADAEYRFSSTTVNITIRKAAVQNEKDHSQAQYAKGRIMTDFSLTDIDGNTYRLSELLAQKQLIILDFWYTTCEPCKMEFPYFESAVQKYGDKMALLAINPINDERAMRTLRQQLNASDKTAISFPMMKDTCNLYLGFAVTSYPVTVFIDSNGIILDIHQGAYTSEKDFLAAIERYLH